MNKNKVIVIGLDGATFDIIKPNINELPNLKKIMESGSYGNLKSTNPPVTCPAWPSFMTGKNPGKHNLFDFMKLDRGKDIEIANSYMIKSKKIHEIVSEHHKKVGVLEIPITFPVKKINGMIIAGYPSPNTSKDKCYPKDIIEEIRSKVGDFHDLVPTYLKQGGNEIEVLEKFEEVAKNRGEIISYLLRNKNLDLFMTNLHHTDVCSHYFWHTHDPTHPKYNDKMGDLVIRGYKLMDTIIGDIMEEVDENANIFIISDHGHGKLVRTVNINIFLLNKGYIKLKNDLRVKLKYFLFRIGFTPSRIYSVIQKLGFLHNFITKFGRSTRDQVLNRFLSYSDIDWKRTKAYSFGHVGQVYINIKDENRIGAVQRGKEYEEIRHNLIMDLKQLKDPDTGEQVVDRIFKKEDIYSGKYTDNAPDLVLKMKNYEYISYPLFASDNKIFTNPLNNYTGSHRMNGIFIAKGPQIKKGKELRGMEIIDIAPTILHILDIPIPTDMDGKVLKDIFEEDSDLAKKPIKYREFDEKEKIRGVMRELRAQGKI